MQSGAIVCRSPWVRLHRSIAQELGVVMGGPAHHERIGGIDQPAYGVREHMKHVAASTDALSHAAHIL